jgi:CHAT domain-containing protein
MLKGGARGRAGALRDLAPQLGAKTTTTTDLAHPYFWAAFIQSGDWRPMSPRPAAAK